MHLLKISSGGVESYPFNPNLKFCLLVFVAQSAVVVVRTPLPLLWHLLPAQCGFSIHCKKKHELFSPNFLTSPFLPNLNYRASQKSKKKSRLAFPSASLPKVHAAPRLPWASDYALKLNRNRSVMLMKVQNQYNFSSNSILRGTRA